MASDIGFINEDGKLGMHFNVTGCMDCQAKVHIPGRFSVYNSMVTMLVCHLAGISDEAILGGTFQSAGKRQGGNASGIQRLYADH